MKACANDPNNSKQHGALAKIGNMLFCSRWGYKTFNQQPFPRILSFRWTCKSALFVKAAPVLAKRSLQQSHFRGRKHIGFLDSNKSRHRRALGKLAWLSQTRDDIHIMVCILSTGPAAFFFLSEPVAFRRVYGLESYSRTSGESIHHRQSVSDTRVPRYQLHHVDDPSAGQAAPTESHERALRQVLRWLFHDGLVCLTFQVMVR